MGLFFLGRRGFGGAARGRWIIRSALLLLCSCLLLLTLFVSTGAGRQAARGALKGDAVYYANRYRGKRMACGGRYYPRKMVAAHRTLACGTKLRVRARNGVSVIVTVRDRGPY